ncbi:MAG TPA: hypothetical protein VFA10_17410 [Ktedonobacteraceae bacterium]|nr:hypothetical protein [Ktedonobacteraceae bacterium]
MERGRKRYQRDWDDETPYEYEERPRRRVRRKRHRRRVLPTLLGGCALGIVLTVLAAAVVVFLAIRSSQGMGNTALPIPIIGGGVHAFTHEDTQQVALASLTQLQVCNKIGNVSVRVDPSATTINVVTKKTVQANSNTDADQEFKRILVEVQPPGTITQPSSCAAAQTTSTPTANPAGTANFLIVNVTLPDNQGLLHSNRDSVDVTVTLPPNILPPSAGPTFVLNVGVAAGNIRVDGINGVLNIRGSSGDVAVSNAILADNSNLSTGEGNITFNGTLALPSDTTTVAKFYLRSEHGNIDVTLPATTNVLLDANTNVGKITSDFAINVQDAGGGSQGYYGPLTPPTGTPPVSILTLDVSTGNVTIHKA